MPREPSSASTPPRVRGRLFALHEGKGLGHARLPDNRRVSISLEHLEPGTTTPKLGDVIEFDLVASDQGFEARQISKYIAPQDTISTNSSRAQTPTQVEKNESLIDLPDEVSTETTSDQFEPGAARAKELYQLAAVARAEGNLAAARAHYEKALEAGPNTLIYAAFAKMEMDRGSTPAANEVIDRALRDFPSIDTFYVMQGQMERRQGNLSKAESILRTGLGHNPTSALLRQSLARVLADIGSNASFKEASELLQQLESEGKVNKNDQAYQRFRALKDSPRAARAYSFFERMPGFRAGIPGGREQRKHVTDIVIDIRNPQVEASFGMSDGYLVRCFDRQPAKSDINALLTYLRSQPTQATIGLIDGRAVSLNNSMAFVVVPGTGAVRDQFMSVLSENNEALIPLDDGNLSSPAKTSLDTLQQLLAQYLGSRDLYSSTLPVSGRRFFGRERLLVQLSDQINRGEFLGIFGLRKMGKTSLVHQLRDEKLRRDAVAYIDLQASSALLLRHFGPIYWEIERELFGRIHQRLPSSARILRLAQYQRFSDVPHPNEHVALLFSEDLRELLRIITSGHVRGVRRVVIVLDELERILPINAQPPVLGYLEFFALLRGLAQTEAFRGAISSVVVAANALISEKASWEGRENPVFALYQPVFVPPFSKQDTSHMVRALGKGMSVYWDDTALDLVFWEMGGHPFLTRQLCSRIIQKYSKRPLTVSKDMVREMVSSFIRDETDKFAQIIELLHTYFPDEERLLEQCALGGPLPHISDKELRHLMGYRLLDNDHGSTRVTPNALRRWLRRRAGIAE